MSISEARERFAFNRKWPPWFYIVVFFSPATLTIIIMAYVLNLEMLFSAIVALAVMNGSINSVIAFITIRLDDKSSESLQHLEFLNNEMGKLEGTLEEANDKVQGFTGDLNDAKDIFRKVGVDLTELDLEPLAEVVEKLKQNKDGLNSVLDHLREVDVSDYIDHAKRIDWKELLSAAEEIMIFIQDRKIPDSPMSRFKPTLISDRNVPDNEDIDLGPEWVGLSIGKPKIKSEEEIAKPLTLTREPKTLSLERKKLLTLRRR